MEGKQIILESYSISDLCLKLFGKCNGRYKKEALNFLKENGFDGDIFKDKNKNSKYIRQTKSCPVCGKDFTAIIGHKKEKKTCSISCSNSFKPKRKIEGIKENAARRRPTGRKEIKVEKDCIICSNHFIGSKKAKTCSNECYKQHMKNVMSEKVDKGDHVGWTSRSISSYPEEFFKGVLKNIEIEYEFNYPVKKYSLGLKSRACYFLDFYIEKDGKKIDLEIDGKQHEMPERTESDIIRDDALTRNGFIVYRIKWKNPTNEKNKIYIEEEITKLRDFLWAGSLNG